MEKKKQRISLAVIGALLLSVVIGIVLTISNSGHSETIKETMKDAVLHDLNKVSLFGLMDVDPSLISAFAVTAVLLFAAALIRIFAIPRFTYVPGKFQLLIEEWVGLFDGLAKKNSPHRNKALGAYIFTAGSYIFAGTMFELFGFQAVTTEGHSISLPAPLANINGAMAMGCFSYLFIMTGGIVANKVKGVFLGLKEFSLPISMTFRLFGALLSGMLTTELVYYYIKLSFVLPVAVGVLFTVLHAVIQAYVLTMLTSVYYGEVTEVSHKKKEKNKKEKNKNAKASAPQTVGGN